MPGLGSDDAEVAFHRDAPARQDAVSHAPDAVEAEEPALVDGFHDEPDLIEMRREHEPRPLLPAALDRRDVAIAIDLDIIGQTGDTLPEVFDELLLEPRHAVQRREFSKRGLERILHAV